VTVFYDSPPSRRPLLFVSHVVPAVLCVAAIFYGGLIRMRELPEVGFMPTDKLLHALTFGGLAFLLMRSARFAWPRATRQKQLLLGALGSSALGALLEVCQAFVPYRSADPLDWLADTVGAGLLVGLLCLCWRLLPGRSHG